MVVEGRRGERAFTSLSTYAMANGQKRESPREKQTTKKRREGEDKHTGPGKGDAQHVTTTSHRHARKTRGNTNNSNRNYAAPRPACLGCPYPARSSTQKKSRERERKKKRRGSTQLRSSVVVGGGSSRATHAFAFRSQAPLIKTHRDTTTQKMVCVRVWDGQRSRDA